MSLEHYKAALSAVEQDASESNERALEVAQYYALENTGPVFRFCWVEYADSLELADVVSAEEIKGYYGGDAHEFCEALTMDMSTISSDDSAYRPCHWRQESINRYFELATAFYGMSSEALAHIEDQGL